MYDAQGRGWLTIGAVAVALAFAPAALASGPDPDPAPAGARPEPDARPGTVEAPTRTVAPATHTAVLHPHL